MDKAKDMEKKYKLKDPGQLKKDKDYGELGPIGLCGVIQQEYADLVKDKDWPALSDRLPVPEVNVTGSGGNGKQRTCHYCGSPDHLRPVCSKLAAERAGQRNASGAAAPGLTLQALCSIA